MSWQTDNLSLSMGRSGARYEAGTTQRTGKFCAIYFVTSGAFSSLTADNFDGTWTSVTFPAGTWIFGPITEFTLSSGSVIAYKGTIQ